MFCSRLLAGTLAGVADRERLLMGVQIWTHTSAERLRVLILFHLTNARNVLGMSVSPGIGSAPGRLCLAGDRVEA